MANTASLYLDQHFTSLGLRSADFLNRERFLEFMQDSSLHAFASRFQK
jgi:hypothetical protein